MPYTVQEAWGLNHLATRLRSAAFAVSLTNNPSPALRARLAQACADIGADEPTNIQAVYDLVHASTRLIKASFYFTLTANPSAEIQAALKVALDATVADATAPLAGSNITDEGGNNITDESNNPITAQKEIK